jgi:predicted DNA-binding protein with PD1-like motif
MTARAAQFVSTRSFGVVFDHGADFFSSLAQVCRDNNIRQGYIPVFVGAFSYVKVAGTCTDMDPQLPMFDSFVESEFVETVGGGTIAWDAETESISPHVHLSVGKRMHGAEGITSHLFEATVQFTLELVVVEVIGPRWTRKVDPDVYDLRLLTFD